MYLVDCNHEFLPFPWFLLPHNGPQPLHIPLCSCPSASPLLQENIRKPMGRGGEGGSRTDANIFQASAARRRDGRRASEEGAPPNVRRWIGRIWHESR